MSVRSIYEFRCKNYKIQAESAESGLLSFIMTEEFEIFLTDSGI